MNRNVTIAKRKVFIVGIATALALACLTKATPLGTIEINKIGYGAESTIWVWGDNLNGISGYGGIYLFTKTGGTGQGNIWPNGLIAAFCFEPPEEAPTGTTTYDVVLPEQAPKPTDFLGGPIGFEKAEYIRELWGRFFDPAWVNGEPFTSQQNSRAAAFTAAIWEILYEDLPPSPLGWDVTVDGTPGDLGLRCWTEGAATANDWLHALDGTGPEADLRVFISEGNQDYIIQVPEPVTIALLGLGSLGLLRKRRA